MKFTSTIYKASSLLLLLISLNAAAQFTNSPYSRFGLGVLLQPGATPYMGMGGLSTPLSDGNVINLNNPANTAFINRTTFQAGIFGQNSSISDGSTNSKFSTGMVNDISMAFKRLGGKWCYAIGLSPYSSSGYSVNQSVSVNDTLDAIYRYSGDGGINKLSLNLARQFRFETRSSRDTCENAHRLAIGLQGQYYFGSIEHIRRVDYQLSNTYNTRITGKTQVADMTLQAGINYDMPLWVKHDVQNKCKVDESLHLLIGATYSLGKNMRSKFSEVSELVIASGTSYESVTDTSNYIASTRGTISMPSQIQLGGALQYVNRENRNLTVGAEYRLQDWSSFKAQFGDITLNDKLSKSSSLNIGAEFTPKPTDQGKNLASRTTYRIGFRQTQSYLMLKETQISQSAFSAGISLPMLAAKAPGSRFHISVEYGTTGTTNNNLIQEKFLYAYFGLTLTPYFINQWFIVRKYD